jgi:hypothetical protein
MTVLKIQCIYFEFLSVIEFNMNGQWAESLLQFINTSNMILEVKRISVLMF